MCLEKKIQLLQNAPENILGAFKTDQNKKSYDLWEISALGDVPRNKRFNCCKMPWKHFRCI